ncbi:MAG: HU family DNA-binding protein [Bacteroidales bacterium]|jgi:predicted histone-like DNA-binding protein|nr:HU family DNA-binding protein [Bacteroidales bacterium]
MAVTYILTQKGNPGNPDAPKKFYAQAKASGELTLKKLSKEISEGSTTVSDTDVLAVLNDLTKILKRHLDNGEIVRFGDFGTFQISVSGEGAETEEKYRPSMIKTKKVVFRPGVDLKEMLNNVTFRKL